MTDRELMQQALEALDEATNYTSCQAFSPSLTREISRVYAALRERLAQQEQEPVAWVYRGNLHPFDPSDWAEGPVTPLYTAPPRREWVGLTEEDFSAINQSCLTKLQAATSAESILKEKNA